MTAGGAHTRSGEVKSTRRPMTGEGAVGGSLPFVVYWGLLTPSPLHVYAHTGYLAWTYILQSAVPQSPPGKEAIPYCRMGHSTHTPRRSGDALSLSAI